MLTLVGGLVAMAAVGVSGAVGADEGGATVTLHAARTTAPINPFIYGQFIEHLGRCIYGGIWAEMLEDRKFYYPVTGRYAPYRSLKETAYPVVGSSPWEILGAADAVTMDRDGPFVGDHTPRLAAGAAIRQRDLGVVAGKAYVGYVWLRAGGPGARATVTLAWGDDDEAGASQAIAIPAIGAGYAKYPLAFTAGKTTDRATLTVRVEGAAAWVGTVSLMPGDNVRGMRADTLALLKKLGGTMYRWPGGNFVSGYDWRDGLGDRDRRPPRRNPAWTGVEHNDFGLDEFIDFCREIDTEPVIAVNTGFGDQYSAALEVEYANGAPTTSVGGAMRAANGHAEPYGVKYWCVGNEMWGPWQLGFMQLKHYTQKHNLVADAMWKADPTLQLIGSGQLGTINRRHDPDEKRGWSEGLLEECADHMNYISEHFYCQEKKDVVEHVGQLAAEIRKKAEGERAVQKRLGLIPKRPVPIAMDEWNYWYGPHAYGELGTRYYLKDALGVAAGLHEYYRQSDIVAMAHYAQTVNVIGCIKTTKTEAFLDATALPLILYRHHFGVTPVERTAEGLPKGVDVTAAWTADREAMTIGLVNPTAGAVTVTLRLDGAAVAPGAKARVWTIAGDDPMATNAPGREDVKIVESEMDFDGTVTLPPLSNRVIRVPAAKVE
jgi:alpha-N-arabinofuranosidase